LSFIYSDYTMSIVKKYERWWC